MNEGALLLAEAMSRKQMVQRDVEVLLKLSTGTGIVSLWLHGHRKPSRKHAYVLEKKLNVSMSSWETPTKKKAPKRVRSARR